MSRRLRPRTRLRAGSSAGGATLSLDFSPGGTAIDPRITFTRSSSATYFDIAGVLQSAAVDAPRFDHDPDTLEARGLLIEEQRTNLLQRSADFTNAYWTTANALAVTANQAVAPDGTVSADRIAYGGNTAYPSVFRTETVATATTHATSLFAKPGASNTASIEFRGSGSAPDAMFNTATGAVASGTGTMFPGGGGFYRCSVIEASVDTSELVILGMGSVIGAADSLLIWGAQLEAGSFSTSYIPTTTAQVTRSADVATGDLGSEFAATGQSAVVIFKPRGLATAARFYQWDDASADNRITLRASGGNLIAECAVGGVVQATVTGPALVANTQYRAFIGFSSGVLRLVVNGTTYADGAPASVPAGLTKRRIGVDSANANQSNAWHERVTEYLGLLATAHAQALTA